MKNYSIAGDIKQASLSSIKKAFDLLGYGDKQITVDGFIELINNKSEKICITDSDNCFLFKLYVSLETDKDAIELSYKIKKIFSGMKFQYIIEVEDETNTIQYFRDWL